MEVAGTISSQFFFFYKKVLSAQKAPKLKTNDFYPLWSFCAHENVVFIV